jgi:hypothetical protein
MRTATCTATAAISTGGRANDLRQANRGRKGNDKKEIFHKISVLRFRDIPRARVAARRGHCIFNQPTIAVAELEDDEAAATLSPHDRLVSSRVMSGRGSIDSARGTKSS